MSESRDAELREAFSALGRDRSGPSFAELTAPRALDAARGRLRRRRGAWLVTVAAVAAMVAIGTRSGNEPDFDRFTALTGIDLGQVIWSAPSDFLLETPGRQLLRSVPLIEVQVLLPSPDSIRSTDTNVTPRRRSDS